MASSGEEAVQLPSFSSTREESCSLIGNNETTGPKRLTIQELDKITNYCSADRLLGQGAFGSVYWGGLDDGAKIAVKVLRNSHLIDDVDFKREFDNLVKLNHPNIVRLVAYSFETQHQHMEFNGESFFAESIRKALCFEFMHMGSLEKHLSEESGGINWEKRFKIIKGACEGLKYLHELSNPIFHLDLKPDNILLDENMTPKLADFGLSKFCGLEQTRVTENVSGTFGYMPHEYLHDRIISNKFDVYSMGVVITEIIAGPRFQMRRDEMSSNEEFLKQVYENWRKRIQETYTSSIQGAYCEQVMTCIEIGQSSMQTDRKKRPDIGKIVKILDETKTRIEKAILLSANSRSWGQAKPRTEKDEHLLKVEAFTWNKAIQATETRDKFPVLVRLTGAPQRLAEEMDGAGVDVVAIVGFNHMGYSNKYAMIVLLDRLGANDRLSIISFGSDMQLTHMSDNGRHVARLRINEMYQRQQSRSVGYPGLALREAAQILLRRGAEENSSRAGCILHMWGDNTPETHKQDISQEFPVHFVDTGDHERRDLKRIAYITSGTYTFLRYYGATLCEVDKALGLFFASIAMPVRIAHTSIRYWSVRITLQAAEGVTISSIASAGSYGNLVSSDQQSATVYLQNICAGQQKTFVVYLTVPQEQDNLLTIGGKYLCLDKLVTNDVAVLRPCRKCLPGEVAIHPKVAAELLRIQLMEGITKGNQDLRLLLDEINNSDEGRAAPEEILSDLEEEVAEMTERYGGDREAMLSTLNCHQLQRSTTTGTSPSKSAFQIVDQQRADEHTNMVKVKGFTRSKAIMYRESPGEFPVLLRVTVAPWCHGWEMPRDGVDVVAVLDTGANMQGERLELVKQAMMIVTDKLGSDDRLSIVPFRTHNYRFMDLTYMSGPGRGHAVHKISHIKASERGTGHICSAALQDGFQILRDRGAEESRKRPGCMILLSDGNYPEILQIIIKSEFPVHTFGLGADHNPKVMKHIADKTFGTYSFVDHDISNIKDALALFITGLTSIAATSIEITLRVHFDIAIKSIKSGNYIHHVDSDKMSGTISIDKIYAGEQKEFIVNLKVGSARKELMTIDVQYKSFTRNNSIDEVEMSVLRPFSEASLDNLAIQPDVAAELTRIRLQNGVLDMVEKQTMTTQGVQKLWNMIKHSDEGRGTPVETLSGLSMEVAQMSRDIPGIPYTLSWLSGHKWQSETTKGTPRNSSVFRTIGQYTNDDTNMVKVETFTRSKAIPSDDTCNKFPVLVRVMAAPRRKAEEMPQVGVDVVAVLDATAGMEGGKLERMKEAMMVVISKLRAEDRLSIVSFNTYENRLTRLTYMTNQGRDVARLKISKLVAGGQGDIAAALREGAEILWWREAESSRRVGCMVFLSDCKNYGVYETEIRPEFPVHTFGLGTDHDPSVMKYIANMTSGTYSFVNRDIGMTKDALTLFITGLTSVAAMSIKITLRTNEGITISSIESGGYVNRVENSEFGTIDIDNIYAGEKKDFIVYLRVAEGKKELMTIGGQYLSHDTVKHLVYTDVYVQHPHQEGLPEDLAIQPDVAAELVRIMLEKGISTMQKAPSKAELQQLWEKIVDSDEGRASPTETLSGLSMDVAQMKMDIENPKEYSKSGLPYMLSWLTSRKWQRATIKGTPCNSEAFQTIGQGADGGASLSR